MPKSLKFATQINCNTDIIFGNKEVVEIDQQVVDSKIFTVPEIMYWVKMEETGYHHFFNKRN